jgi:methyl-accepting chemotaxis protein
VVASEVKALATQTARSTGEITQRIAEVRSATAASVAAVSQIETTITEVNAIASSIAAAVEQQGAATAEIARNVTETATAASDVQSRISEVSAEAERTDRQAADVRANTEALAGAVGSLRHSVVRVVRTSSTEVDRRGAVRFGTDLPCRVSGAGVAGQSARVVDLSEGGACVAGGPAMAPGTNGSLTMDEAGLPLPFTVCGTESGMLRVAFAPNEAAAAKLRLLLGRLSARRAA